MPESNQTPIVLIGSFLIFYLLEPMFAAQPIPQNRTRHTITNLLLTFVNIAVLSASGLFVIMVANWVTQNKVGLLHWLNIEVHPIFQALMYDGFNYTMHVLNHKFDFLWRFHRSHHSDYYLDVTSAFRFHPIESVIRASWQSLVIMLMGFSVESMFMYQIWVVLALNASHTNLRVPNLVHSLGKYIFVLPNIHRFHHSRSRSEHDANYGIGFMIWDHLFGTYKEPKPIEDFRIGLEGYERENDTFKNILLDPVKKS